MVSFDFASSLLALLRVQVQIVVTANKMELLDEMLDPNEREVGLVQMKVNKLMSQPLHRTDHCP